MTTQKQFQTLKRAVGPVGGNDVNDTSNTTEEQ